MAEISAKAVMSLREKMGISMMECKKALVESDGNEEQAIELLRKKGAAKAEKKSDRTTSEGAVIIANGAYAKVQCETDFVARNDSFVALVTELAEKTGAEGEEAAKAYFETIKADRMAQLGENLVFDACGTLEGEVVGGYVHSNRKVATLIALNGGSEELARDLGMHATAMNPVVVSPDQISDDLVEKEKEIWEQQLKEEGKPENIIENIMKGKEAKFRNEGAFIAQEFVKDPTKKIADVLKENGAELVNFIRVEV